MTGAPALAGRLRILLHLAGTDRASVGELCRLLGQDTALVTYPLAMAGTYKGKHVPFARAQRTAPFTSWTAAGKRYFGARR